METGLSNLCLAGGCALNCLANGKILKSGHFDRLWIQPASGDAGGALGAALGQAGVNIASFHLGRPAAGGDAIALLSLDQPLSEAVLAKVQALPHVRQSQALAF